MYERTKIAREAIPDRQDAGAAHREITRKSVVILSTPKVESVAVLGWLPTLSLVMAVGIALIAIGCSGSRMSANWAQPVFWSGVLTLVVPPSIRLCMQAPARQERLIILAMMAVGYYLIKVFYSPVTFTMNDELQHWRSTYDILQTHQLFQQNPSLQVSPSFPGLETVADAVINLSGLSIFQAGLIEIGLVFITAPITLFLLFERVSRSPYLAGIAGLLYFANPSYLLGYSQYAYEALAIPLTFMVIYLLTIRIQRPPRLNPLGLNFAILLLISAIIITHHLSSYWLAGLLSLWAVIALVRRHPEEKRLPLFLFALLAVAGCVLWLYVTGNSQLIIGYISAPMIKAVNGMVGIVTGTSLPRTLFRGQGGNGTPTPLWMQIPSYLSVLLISLSILLGLWELRSRSRIQSLAIVLGLLSLGYFVGQATRVSVTGLVMTDRISSVVAFPVSFVVANGVVRAVRSLRSPSTMRIWRPVLAGCVSLMLLGTATAVVASRELPGPYKPYVFTRDINALGIATAEWANDSLGPNHRVGADFISMLIMGSYGHQQVVTEENDFFAETTVFASKQLDPAEIGYLKQHGVEYLLIDNNLVNDLVLPSQNPHAVTYNTSLDGLPTVSRIYDSGSITIYHLGFVSPVIDLTPPGPALP